jgi:hypothetical protein
VVSGIQSLISVYMDGVAIRIKERLAHDEIDRIRISNTVMSRSRIAILVIGIVLISQAVAPRPVMGQPQPAQPVCTGKFKGGLQPSPAELTDILKKHAEWLKDGGSYSPELSNDPRKANLCDAKLILANLRGAALTNADLSHANLRGANLIGADLMFANLTGTRLNVANLEGANLSLAALTDANLFNAHMDGANLTFADLNGASLEFDPDSPPRLVPGIDTARNLELVKFQVEPAGLVKLRAEFKDLGLRAQESQLTYAIRRSELSRKSYPGTPMFIVGLNELNAVFFDWTCQYGMSPSRPLLIVAALAVILSIVYIFAQVDPGPNGGIWAVWDEHRVKQAEGSDKAQQLTYGFPSARSDVSFLLLAFYFSLLSATRIGWSGLNFGTWITRIQPREYSLQATGWVRVVSGIQSLISVYLVAHPPFRLQLSFI